MFIPKELRVCDLDEDWRLRTFIGEQSPAHPETVLVWLILRGQSFGQFVYLWIEQ